MRLFRTSLVLSALMTSLAGCRTAVVTGPNDPDTKTVVTVHQEPKTQPSDKGLELIDKR